MMKKTFILPCSWQLYDRMFVEAETLDEAIHKAIHKESLPDGEYVTDSFRIDEELISVAGIEVILPNGKRSWVSYRPMVKRRTKQ